MKTFVKCELCNAEVSGERCIFAIHTVETDSKEYYFCCEQHAEKFKDKTQESSAKKMKK